MSQDLRATVDAARSLGSGTMVHIWIPNQGPGHTVPALTQDQQVTITIPEGKP